MLEWKKRIQCFDSLCITPPHRSGMWLGCKKTAPKYSQPFSPEGCLCWRVYEQEAQLSQRDRATLRVIEYFAKSLKITQGHSKWHCWVGLVLVPSSIPLKLCLYSEIFSVKEWRDLETGGRSLWRSLKVTPTFYWSAVVNMGLSCTVFELFDVE